MNVISFEDAIELLESGKPVWVRYVSYDKRRKTGGKIKDHELVITKMKSDRVSTEEAKKRTAKASNHYDNFTRNCFQCIDGNVTMSVKTIHLPLILQINNLNMML